jgi:hypothetical protein
MIMRLIEFSNKSIKAVHKFLGATGLSALEAAGLNEQEKDAVLEAYGAFRGEVEEIQLDEHYAVESKENA